MKILVYGAGPLGSLFAARLYEAGHDVSILARGQRLAELREHGIVLEDAQTDRRSVARVNVVDRLDPNAIYDLVLVIMRNNKVAEILPLVVAHPHSPNVLFLMNNAAGPDQLIGALGADRVLIGFPASGGMRRGYVIRYLGGGPDRIIPIPFGEVDGRITERTRQVAAILASMPGYTAEIRTDMDAWLKTHAALLMPSIAPALYAAGTDRLRLANTRDLLVLIVRAVHEGFRVLHALNIPITPPALKIFEWIPEPLLVLFVKRLLLREQMEVALVGHANAARDEVTHLADEFLTLARQTSVPTPSIDRLYPYLDPATPLMPEGSSSLPMQGRVIWIGLGVVIGIVIGLAWLGKQFVQRAIRS